MSEHIFLLTKFTALSGRELHDYMEPLLKLSQLAISKHDIQLLVSRLAHDDEYHLVYALLLLGRFAPDAVVPHLAQYLASDCDSVFCSVLNIIEHLPERLMTGEFQASINNRATAKSARPELLLFINKHSEKMRNRVR